MAEQEELIQALRDNDTEVVHDKLSETDSVYADTFYAAFLHASDELFEAVARRYEPKPHTFCRLVNKIMGVRGAPLGRLERFSKAEAFYDMTINWDRRGGHGNQSLLAQHPLVMVLGLSGKRTFSPRWTGVAQKRQRTGDDLPAEFFIEWLLDRGATVTEEAVELAYDSRQPDKLPLLACGTLRDDGRAALLERAHRLGDVTTLGVLVRQQGVDPNDRQFLRRYAEHFPYTRNRDTLEGRRLPRLLELGADPTTPEADEALRELIETLVRLDPPRDSKRLLALKQLVAARERRGVRPPDEKLIRQTKGTAVKEALTEGLSRRSRQYARNLP